MKNRAEQWRLAMLVVHCQNTSDFTDQGAIALSRWYEEFCATKGGNLAGPLDLSGTNLKTLPALVRLPLSLGTPYLKLGNNPDLVDLTELQDLPLITKLGTIEQAIIAERSAPKILILSEIRNALLTSKTKLKLSLERVNIDEIPVYIQLLSSLEELELKLAMKLKSVRTLNNLKQLRVLSIGMAFYLQTLTILTNLPKLESLWITNSLHGVENLHSLEYVYLYRLDIDSIDNLKKLPNLKELNVSDCNNLQRLERLNEFPSLKKITISTDNLQEISIDENNKHLEIMGISGANRLESITGINYLRSIQKIRIRRTPNLQRLGSIEDAISLEYTEINSSDIGFLKQILKPHIESGRYSTFTYS